MVRSTFSDVKPASMVVRWITLVALLATTAMATSPVVGRDPEGLYKDSPLHDWFEHLASRKGLCCSFADGYVVADADWQTTTDGKHYRVRVPLSAGDTQMDWVDVPDEAVITEPNRAGRTMVWPLYANGGAAFRQASPGAMAETPPIARSFQPHLLSRCHLAERAAADIKRS